MDSLKAELWTHITNVIKLHPQQLQKLRGYDFRQAIAIADIQFAMSNYHDLESLKEILEATQKMNNIDH